MSVFDSLPQPGDHLFKKLSKPPRRDREGSWLAYARAYKEAADDLVAARPLPFAETQAYPIVFLYRHFIELELKSVVALNCVLQTIEESEDNAQQRVESILRTHDLAKLCDACRRACLEANLYHGNFIHTFQAFETCVLEIAEHDPGSYAFRYPIDKKLNQSLVLLTGIDAQHLKNMVDKIGRFVAVIRHALQKHLEWAEQDPQGWTDEDERIYPKDITGKDEEEARWEGENE